MKMQVHGSVGQGALQNIVLQIGPNEVEICLRESHAEAFLVYQVRTWTKRWVEQRLRSLGYRPDALYPARKEAANRLLRCLSYHHRSIASITNGLNLLKEDLLLLVPSPGSRYFKKSSDFIHDLFLWIDEQRIE